MNKKILTVMAISTLSLGVATTPVAYSDEAQERTPVILKPGEFYPFTNYDDGGEFIIRCLFSRPSNLPICKIKWMVTGSGEFHLSVCVVTERLGSVYTSLEDLKKDPGLLSAIRNNLCQTDASYDAPEKDNGGYEYGGNKWLTNYHWCEVVRREPPQGGW